MKWRTYTKDELVLPSEGVTVKVIEFKVLSFCSLDVESDESAT